MAGIARDRTEQGTTFQDRWAFSVIKDWRLWGGVVLCLSIVVVANLLFSQVVAFGAGRMAPIDDQLGRWLVIWLGRVAVVPVVWWFASLAHSTRSWPRALGIHFVGAFASVAVHTVITIPGTSLRGLVGSPDVSEAIARTDLLFWLNYLHWDSIDQLKAFFWIDIYSYGAIVAIFYAFHYHSEMMRRAARAAELESRLIEARLHALRSQLNPHFLFNTLNGISVLARRGDREVVSRMIEELSVLLRRALDDDRPEMIPLVEELEFINGYLTLQSLRYSDRLTVSLDVAADVRNALVPSMILQPIIENAIEHGVSACVGASTVAVRASRHDGVVSLQVSDSGPGFPRTGASREKGIGLRNTEGRLEQLYGRSQSIAYGSTPGGGATVTIELPFCEAGAVVPSRVA